MRFLPICISVLLLAGGAPAGQHFCSRTSPLAPMSASPYSASSLLLRTAGLLCQRPQGEGRLGPLRVVRGRNDDLRRVDLDGDRPARARGLTSFRGFAGPGHAS